MSPFHLIGMLDEGPDALWELREIERWYARMALLRDNERLRPLLKPAFDPNNPDKKAQQDIQEVLDKRAKARGTTDEEELDRLYRMLKDD